MHLKKTVLLSAAHNIFFKGTTIFMKLMIASSNKNKISEITSILQTEVINLEFVSFFISTEPEEPYTTFLENACHKAKYYGNISNLSTLSEDTGLCIEALDQFPGVKTKDFIQSCGGTLDDVFINLKQKMQLTKNYSAQFICATALYIPASNTMISYQAIEYGTITFPPRGNDGFGFDPVFIPSGHHQTIAELGQHFKNCFCHRALAIKGLFRKVAESNSKW